MVLENTTSFEFDAILKSNNSQLDKTMETIITHTGQTYVQEAPGESLEEQCGSNHNKGLPRAQGASLLRVLGASLPGFLGASLPEALGAIPPEALGTNLL